MDTMERLADVIRRYGDIELLAACIEATEEEDVRTTEDLLAILESELEYMSE